MATAASTKFSSGKHAFPPLKEGSWHFIVRNSFNTPQQKTSAGALLLVNWHKAPEAAKTCWEFFHHRAHQAAG